MVLKDADPTNLNGKSIEQLKGIKFAKLKSVAGKSRIKMVNPDESSRPDSTKRANRILEQMEGLSVEDIQKTIEALCSPDNRVVRDKLGNNIFARRTAGVAAALGVDEKNALSTECLDVLLLLKYRKEQERKAELKAARDAKGLEDEAVRGDE